MSYSKALQLAFAIWILSILFFFIITSLLIPIGYAIIGVFLASITTIIGIFPGSYLIKEIIELKIDTDKEFAILIFIALIISNGLGLIGLWQTDLFDFIWSLPASSIALIFSIIIVMKPILIHR